MNTTSERSLSPATNSRKRIFSEGSCRGGWVTAHSPYVSGVGGQVELEEFKCKKVLREQNACSDTCNTDPIFYLLSEATRSMSALKNCHKLSWKAVEAALAEFPPKGSLLQGICHLSSLRHLPFSSPIPTQLTSSVLVLRSLEMQRSPRKQSVNFVCCLGISWSTKVHFRLPPGF